MLQGAIATFMKQSYGLQIHCVMRAYWKDLVQPIRCVEIVQQYNTGAAAGYDNAGRRSLSCIIIG